MNYAPYTQIEYSSTSAFTVFTDHVNSLPHSFTATSLALILPLPMWCQVLDAFLRQHGSEEGGDYFLGGTYSAAETITTPFVRRMLVALPVLRDVDVAAIVKAEKLERLDRWFQVRL